MKSQIALSVALAVLVSSCVLLAYDRVVVRRAQQLAVVDLAEVYRAKESQFAQQLTAGGSPDDRKQAQEAAAAFAKDLTLALEELPRECGCVVLLKTAVVGRTGNVIDLTSALKARLDRK